MSFCEKSVQYSFLGLTTNTDKPPFGFQPYHHQYPISSSGLTGGLGLISATDDTDHSHRSPNVLESPSVKSTPPSSPDHHIFTTSPPRKNPGGIGFIDDMGGGVDGLMSCTESLGFESSDERRFDDKIEEAMIGNDSNRDSFQMRRRTTTTKCKKAGGEVKKFPPPLSSLNPNGRRNFFLRAVRKDGRLELTEVRIDRTEILRASREDGRLRLQLVRDEDFQDSIEEAEEKEGEVLVDEEIEREQDGEENETVVVVEKEDQVEQKVNGGVEEDREKERPAVEEWEFPVSGEGWRRCHKLVSHHDQHSNHHHNLHVWRQHCVTTG